MRTRIALIPLAAVVLVAGCATVPTGPNVMVLPGPQKSFEQFQADQMSCQQYANAAIGGTSAQDNAANSAAASALVGTAIGAAALPRGPVVRLRPRARAMRCPTRP